ncbi:MAG: hypothetical protein Q8909_12085, partial [Bacteroidota bacterium]|nr:hypothetical protein [Bacteroidota bacterium]
FVVSEKSGMSSWTSRQKHCLMRNNIEKRNQHGFAFFVPEQMAFGMDFHSFPVISSTKSAIINPLRYSFVIK